MNRQLFLEFYFYRINAQLKNVASCDYCMKSKFFALISKARYLPILFLPVSQHALCSSQAVSSCHPTQFLMLIPRLVSLFMLLSQLDYLLYPLYSENQSFFKASLSSCHFQLLWTIQILPFSQPLLYTQNKTKAACSPSPCT